MESPGPSSYAAGPSADMTRSTEEDSLVDGPSISADASQSAMRREFQSVPTACPAGLSSLIHVVYVVSSMCVGVSCVSRLGQQEVCSRVSGSVQGDSAIVLGKVFSWVSMSSLTVWMHHHHSRVRSRGYSSFYRQTQRLKQSPLSIHSTGNVSSSSSSASRLSQNIHIIMSLCIVGAELSVATPCLSYYTVKVMQFNSERAAPDVSQEENSHTYTVTSSPTETGFRGSSSSEEVVEKQADSIEYSKQHNTLSSRRSSELTAQH